MTRAHLSAFLLATAGAPGMVVGQAATSTAPSTVAAYVRPAPPGQLVEVGGRRLHVDCKGSETGPTVMIEAGLSQFTAHSTYGKAQDLIAVFAHVCTYDRAGLGWSDGVAGARTHDDMVDDLHRLIGSIQLRNQRDRRLVLVGHSMGGLLVRLYAERHPADVAGIILVDATPEATLFGEGAIAERKAMVTKINAGLAAAKPGVPLVPMGAETPAEVMLAFTPEVIATVRKEYEAIDRIPDAKRGATGYGLLGSLPLTVIRRGRTATPTSAEDESWRTMQEALTTLSTRSELIVAQNAGHVIPYDRPDVVADAVRRMVLGLPKR